MSYKNMYNSFGLNNELRRLEYQAKMNWKKELRNLEYFGLKDGMRVLEVGSGPGFITELLLKDFPNLKITALEIDPNMITISQKRLKDYIHRIHFVNESLLANTLESNKYDFVLVRYVYQHLSDTPKATSEIYRLLKPGGKVVITDVDNDIWGVTYPHQKMMPQLNSALSNFQGSNGGDRFIGRKLLKLLKGKGFTNLDFEVLANHSDVIGMDSFLISKEVNKINVPENSKMAPFINQFKNFYNSPKSTIIQLVLMAYGEKPYN
ncbi:class I SAM-dependent methyltransferase [Clostridium sp.]|uniref:class I SAM-dependent methyltransferase n=1 Tax=Clostridium sp. TaxID=1506 RepID=UPI003F3AB57A